jgi:dolichol-phosphate mannosyltransferase
MPTLICITTYNEAETIGPLVRRFVRVGWSVVVSDGGSTDGTCTAALDAGATVLISQGKEGIGPCLMRAWRYALDNGFWGVLQIDAGGSHNPDDALNLLLASDDADMVIGSRFMPGATYNNTHGKLLRPFMSRLAARMMNFAQMGAHYTDWTSGFRYFSDKAIAKLLTRRYHTDMHTWQIEVLAHAGEMGFRIKEVPIHYTAGRSSFNKKIAHEAVMTWLHVLNHIGWVGSRLSDEETT